MPFKKNDPKTKEYSDKGNKAKRELKEKNADIMVQAIVGGFQPYKDKLAILEAGGNLSDSEKLYMEKIEKMAEFAIPKLARTDVTSGGEKISGFGLGHKELTKE